ncbi:hypothetical protein [Aquihabitans sp. McL0605]|uniref:hypothetical protein n=1 Tax=Aquihabitans sp. McL0605 TaxID=3415671 RepID=UPI003CE81C89
MAAAQDLEAGTASGGSARSRIRMVALVAVVMVAVAAITTLTGAHLRSSARAETCSALGASVDGLDEIDWSNGITSSGPAWSLALSEGLTEADQPSRAAIARTVRADEHGYQRLLRSLPDHLRAPARRLHELALDPEVSYRQRNDPAALADAYALDRYAARHCGLV